MLVTTKPKPAAIKPGTFYGGSLPRPRVYTAPPLLNAERVDAPPSMNYYLCKWARDATWQMGGVSTKPKPLQGKIVSRMRVLETAVAKESKKKLREIKKRKEETRKKLKKYDFEESELEDSDLEDTKDAFNQFLKENDNDSGAEESDDEAVEDDEEGDGEREDLAQGKEDKKAQADAKRAHRLAKRQEKELAVVGAATQEEQPQRRTQGQKNKRTETVTDKQGEVEETPVVHKKARHDAMSTGGSEKASSVRRPKTPKKMVSSTGRKAIEEKNKRMKEDAMTSRRSLRLTLTPQLGS